ncbi:uncharacterized protein N7483_004433 [Penicillium malachiteum]|uniref:uncharacterized protein n=1 Tax=Penicillium malachiteum TaxID=1324776 RepID=UPI0025467ACA|nr:uncharacterized protein N7483_004433 [Penicillium malachiteum]KAJ5729925.1 hypothetical protein N7483_004433 [Penicillium malachiteum]
MANLTQLDSSEADVLASQAVCIDLEFYPQSRKVIQVGIVDTKGERILDCFTKYSEKGKANLHSTSCWQAPKSSAHDKIREEQIRRFYSKDGTLSAEEIADRLQKTGISRETIFLAWATRPFGLYYLRDWLDAEGFQNILPPDEKVCLILMEFRQNLREFLGSSCFRGGVFPATLPVIFMVAFGEDHPLAGKNHHALVDAKQLALLTQLFIDLCKPP